LYVTLAVPVLPALSTAVAVAVYVPTPMLFGGPEIFKVQDATPDRVSVAEQVGDTDPACSVTAGATLYHPAGGAGETDAEVLGGVRSMLTGP
jgi:hypothetical protein